MTIVDDKPVAAAAGTAPILEIPLSDITTARNEPLVVGGRLEGTLKSGTVRPVVAYTASRADKFSEAARGIEQRAKGEPLILDLKPQKTRCPKCHRLLPEKDGHCPACFSK